MTANNLIHQVFVGVLIGLGVMILAAWMQREKILFPPVAENDKQQTSGGGWFAGMGL